MLKFRVFYGAVVVAAILFYLYFDGYLSFVILILTFLLPIISLLFTIIARAFLHLRLDRVSPAAAKDMPAQFYVEIVNTSILPIASAKLTLECCNSLCALSKKAEIHLTIGAHKTTRIERSIASQYCGRLMVQLNRIQLYDYFGIFVLSKKINMQTAIFVLPLTIQIDAPIDSRANYTVESDTYSKVKSGDDSSEIFDIREYRSGDRVRSIHWKLSSKLDKLMVKESSLPLDNSVVLLFDLLSAPMALIDTEVEAIVSISQFLIENQILHTVEWYDSLNAQFDNSPIEQIDDLSVLLNRVLAATPYDDKPNVLTCHNSLNGDRECSHAIYVTTKLFGDALLEFYSNTKNHKTTVLLVTGGELPAEQKALADSLTAMNCTVLTVHPGKLRNSIDGLII